MLSGRLRADARRVANLPATEAPRTAKGFLNQDNMAEQIISAITPIVHEYQQEATAWYGAHFKKQTDVLASLDKEELVQMLMERLHKTSTTKEKNGK